MPGLSQSVELADGRRAAYEVVGDGTPLFYFQGGPGFSAALLRRDAELLADAVLGAELIIVPDCGHFIPAEARESFRAAVIEFAGGSPAAAAAAP
jgi:hypothetical protein